MMSATGFDALIAELRAITGANLSIADAVRDHHSRGESHHPAAMPHAVVFPESTEAVQAIVRACASHRCPVVPFGAGSSLEGHVNPIHGGVSVDMTRMNRVVRVSADDLDATVEAGVTRKQFERHLRSTGLIFHLDPGADATLGGMAATRASGTTAVRYGTMRDAVLGLKVVLADVAVAQAVELEEQRREHRIRQLREAVDRLDQHFVQELDARDRDPELDRRDHRADGAFDVVEITGG